MGRVAFLFWRLLVVFVVLSIACVLAFIDKFRS